MFEYIGFTRSDGSRDKGNIRFFGLSTCGFCRRAKEFLDDRSIIYDYVMVDNIPVELKTKAKEEFAAKFGETMRFPTLVIDESDYQIGFIKPAWEKIFYAEYFSPEELKQPGFKVSDRISSFVDNAARHNGWLVNPDSRFRSNLEEGLSVNLERYGFFHCPCRESDSPETAKRDIACPCRYAAEDIREWGHCYCGLFVSEEFHKSGREPSSIPERRDAQ